MFFEVTIGHLVHSGGDVADFFIEHSHMLALKPISSPNSGFRPCQLGALHSVAAHFSVYDEPAIVSLPTGYGKTAVIMALPFVGLKPCAGGGTHGCAETTDLGPLRRTVDATQAQGLTGGGRKSSCTSTEGQAIERR